MHTKEKEKIVTRKEGGVGKVPWKRNVLIEGPQTVVYPEGVLGGSCTPLFSSIIFKIIKLDNVVDTKNWN